MQDNQPKYLWCLDPGHGPKTPGKRSPLFQAKIWKMFGRFFEFEFNRDIVKRLAKLMDNAGYQYFITVDMDAPIDDALKQRVDAANNKESDLPKIFLSIHSNAGQTEKPDGWSTAEGVEVWHYNPSRIGLRLATHFCNSIAEATSMENRGPKCKGINETQFYVLRKTSMLAILTENGFYNNRSEVLKLVDPGFRQKIAEAHFKSIQHFETHGIYDKIA